MITDRRTPVFQNVTRDRFENDILPLGRPAILKGLVCDWPLVQAALEGPQAMATRLKERLSDEPAEVFVAPPSEQGRMFFNRDLKGFNFKRAKTNLSMALDWLVANQHRDAARGECEASAMQGLPAAVHAPDFTTDHPMPLIGPEVAPRLWIGNSVNVRTHFDLSLNIACNVSGRRTFTLFPPEQLANLYPGPFNFTPGGTPVSMVDIDAPDLDAYPRFAEAIASAEVAELEPGDAIYMPAYWWHNVRSNGPLNLLVNYWWTDARPDLISPFKAFYVALGSIKLLPAAQREMWRQMLDYYVFESHGDPVAHLKPENQGVLAKMTADKMPQFRRFVTDLMNRDD